MSLFAVGQERMMNSDAGWFMLTKGNVNLLRWAAGVGSIINCIQRVYKLKGMFPRVHFNLIIAMGDDAKQ